jgi:hypothetical protein
MTSYTRTLKPSAANDFASIVKIGEQVRRVLAGIVNEDMNDLRFIDEIKIQMQPRPDGGLAIIGWISRDPVKGIPDEQYDEEIEIIPEIIEPSEFSLPRNMVTTPESNPFKR